MIDLKEMESAQQSAQRFNEAVAKASHVSFERGYKNGYLDGRRDKEKKMSNPNRKEYSYSEKPNSSDLINRQDALEALRTCYETERIDYTNGNEYINYEQAVHEVEQLSSAQPERTCVNCGRTVNNGGWYADGRTRCPIEEHYALPKDGYCHLWEKRNVTDDDYPERREE